MGPLTQYVCRLALAPVSVRVALALPAIVSALFLAAWGDGIGIPVWQEWSFYHQLRVIEGGTLALVLPWIATRTLTATIGPGPARLSAFTGLAPSRVELCRAGAAFGPTALGALASWPVAILAQRMSGGTVAVAAADQMVWVAVAALAVAVTSCLTAWVPPIGAWVWTSACLGAVLALGRTHPPAQVAVAAGALAVAVWAWVAWRADREAPPSGGGEA